MNPMFFSVALFTSNPDGFFASMRNTVTTWINSGIDGFLIPVAVLILAVVAVVIIVKAAAEHKRNQGDDLFDRLKPAIICIIIIAILLTKNAWWGFLVGGAA